MIPIILILSFLPLMTGTEEGSVIVIKADGKTYRYSLSQNRMITVPGTLGESVLEVKDGRVRFISAPCPNRTCMRGSISRYPESLVCLPNDVIVQIEGEGETDAVTF